MMYLFDFFGFLFSELGLLLNFGVSIFNSVIDSISHITTLISVLPLWLSVPFGILLHMALLFRVSQFIPAIGGAK